MANNDWNVQNFLNQLRQAQPQPRNNEPKEPTLEKTYLNIPDNLGRYQIFPMISTTTWMPFEYLYKTREINIVTGTNQDGTKRTAWHKLLPVNAYNFVDNTGRLVSSLTQAEKELLESAYGVFDRMFDIVPEANRRDTCRVKNYTIGNAYVINKFGLKDPSKAVRSKFSTLLVCTSKDFANAINKDIDMQMINYGNDNSFLGQIYNRDLTNRTGWLIFNIGPAANGIGFSVSATHTANLQPTATEGLVISKEEAELMKDPIKNFLGWQAGKEKLFNAELITKIIEEMNVVISRFSSAGTMLDPNRVAQATQYTAQQVQPSQPMTNDPMVAAQQSQSMAPQQNIVQSPEQMANNNVNPFDTPPAAQFDPLSQAPQNYGQQFQQPQAPQQNPFGYQQPNFAQPQQAAPGVNNPFDTTAANPYKQ